VKVAEGGCRFEFGGTSTIVCVRKRHRKKKANLEDRHPNHHQRGRKLGDFDVESP
jgi:hypothetical protein